MPKLTPTLFLVFALPLTALSQDQAPPFSNGIFYTYSNTKHIRYRLERNGETEKDINLDSGDSSVWRMNWKDNQTYTFEYIGGNSPQMKGMEKFLEKHKIACKIEKVTADYYIYSGYFDKVTNLPISKDTVWLHEKAVVAYSDLYRPVNGMVELKKMHFSDTSTYALLYVYRPGKMTNSWSDFLVYCNDNLLWVARNRAGTVVKILREGEIELSSRLLKDSASVKVDIHFGHVYYVKSMVHWGLYKRGNYHLEMASVPADQGVMEFAEVIR